MSYPHPTEPGLRRPAFFLQKKRTEKKRAQGEEEMKCVFFFFHLFSATEVGSGSLPGASANRDTTTHPKIAPPQNQKSSKFPSRNTVLPIENTKQERKQNRTKTEEWETVESRKYHRHHEKKKKRYGEPDPKHKQKHARKETTKNVNERPFQNKQVKKLFEIQPLSSRPRR
jgi:hypothetical protein